MLYSRLSPCLSFAAAVLVSLVSASCNDSDDDDDQSSRPTRPPEQLAAAWWEWALSIPPEEHALAGETQSGDVVFLPSPVTDEPVALRATIGLGSQILLPIAADLCALGETATGADSIPPCAESSLDNVADVAVTLDGDPLESFRIGVPCSLTVTRENFVALEPGAYESVRCDGYWVLLEPLSGGDHVITVDAVFGEADTPELTLEVTYEITIEPAPEPRRAVLSVMVVVGDSLSAGFQNGSLRASQQESGWAAIVARQAGVELPHPLIVEPGIPPHLMLVSPQFPPVIESADGMSSGRVDPSIQPYNLAVPGHTVEDALTGRPEPPVDDLTDLVLGPPGLLEGISRSQVEWAEALEPTTVFVWLGNNDTLGAALAGDASLVTPVEDFERAYSEVMERLAGTGATVLVANIPDVTVVPFLTSAEEVATIAGAPLAAIGPALGIGPGDFIVLEAIPGSLAILTGMAAGPLPPESILDAGEVATIRSATETFNAFIARQADENGATLVDIHRLTETLDKRGFLVGDTRLTTGFLGGLFSLDGVHPSDTGYAIVANEFITALNTRLAMEIPPVSIRQVVGEDPLVASAPEPRPRTMTR